MDVAMLYIKFTFVQLSALCALILYLSANLRSRFVYISIITSLFSI